MRDVRVLTSRFAGLRDRRDECGAGLCHFGDLLDVRVERFEATFSLQFPPEDGQDEQCAARHNPPRPCRRGAEGGQVVLRAGLWFQVAVSIC